MTKFLDDSECRKYLESLQREFEISLSGKLSERTIRKHSANIGLLIDFLCFDCGVRDLDDITAGMVNSGFRRWHTNKVGDATESELKSSVKKFFRFLEQEKGFTNRKVLDRL
jgi:site-specific recombinase XerD